MAASEELVYLDNGVTSFMPPPVVKAMVKWCNMGSIRGRYRSAQSARKMCERFRLRLADICEFNLNDYEVVFTSGASESNSFLINSVIRSYSFKIGKLPHLIVSEVEHCSILQCVRQLEAENLCQLTVLPVDRTTGAVSSTSLDAALRPSTCLVSIAAASSDTGVMNNLSRLSSVANQGRVPVPFHSDLTQLFCRSTLNISALGLDAFTLSFHRIGGPPGIGALVVKKILVEGYALPAQIVGTQNNGLRGGIENIPAIGASFAAFNLAMEDRDEKTARMISMRDSIYSGIAKLFPCFPVAEHEPAPVRSIDGVTPPPVRQWEPSKALKRALSDNERHHTPVVFTMQCKNMLPNTAVLFVRASINSKAMQTALEERGIVVGTFSSTLGYLHPKLREGYLKIVLSDDNTPADVEKFIASLAAIIAP